MDSKTLENVQRLIRCGFVGEYARRICERYADALGPEGVEEYIHFIEKLMDDAREYPKEV